MSFHKDLVGLDLHEPSQIKVENNTGSAIPAFRAVGFSQVGTSLPEIFLANGATQTVRGITHSAIANGAEGTIIGMGRLSGVNTSAFLVGDLLYAGVGGVLSDTLNGLPVAVVLVSSATDGVIWINGSGINAADVGASAVSVTDTATVDLTYSLGVLQADVLPGGVNHNLLLNYVANQHIDHSSVSITAGTGLTGGGDITTNRTISMPNVGTPGTYTKVTTDAQGRVSSGSTLLSSDIPNLDTSKITTGVFPIVQGGTNSAAALNNNRVMVSNSGAIVEAAAITANRALISDANGIPTHSSVTNTELGYVSGVTSSIQTQLNDKVSKAGDTMTGFLTLNADPTNALHASTKQYVDNLVQGLKAKQSVRVATTGPIDLSTDLEDGDVVDGVTLVEGNRVLVKNQTIPEENGIYVVPLSGAASRSSDADSYLELVSAYTFVEEGTANADRGFLCTNNQGGTLGVTPINWIQFSSIGTYDADGQGIEITGQTFSLELDGTTLSKSASGLRVATGGITNNEISNTAGIAYSKLNLTNSIVNADIATSAAIQYSKLEDIAGYSVLARATNTSGPAAAVTAGAVDRLLARTASGIEFTQLSDAMVPTNTLSYSKLVDATGLSVLGRSADTTGSMASIVAGADHQVLRRSGTSLGFGLLVNNNIDAAAAIAVSKLAALTANRAVQTGAGGFLEVSTTTSTELGYLSGVTSAVQTQINSKYNISGGSLTGAAIPAIVALTDAPTIAVNATLGNQFTVTLTANRTLGKPTGAVNGQLLLFVIRQDGVGGRTLTPHADYRFGDDITSFDLSSGPNKTTYIGVRYHSGDDKFDVISLKAGF